MKEPSWTISTPVAVRGKGVAAEYSRNPDVRQAVVYALWDLDPNEGWVKSAEVGRNLKRLLGWHEASKRMIGKIIINMGPYGKPQGSTGHLFEARGHSDKIELCLNDFGWALIEDLGFPRSQRRGGE